MIVSSWSTHAWAPQSWNGCVQIRACTGASHTWATSSPSHSSAEHHAKNQWPPAKGGIDLVLLLRVLHVLHLNVTPIIYHCALLYENRQGGGKATDCT